MGGGRYLGSFDELLSMAVLTASWWMLLIADLKQVLLSGSSVRYYWMVGQNRPIRDRRRSGGHLAVCGRSNGRDVVVDGMPWRTAGKSIRDAGKLVVPEPLMHFGDICHFRTASGNYQYRILCPLMSLRNGVQTGQQYQSIDRPMPMPAAMSAVIVDSSVHVVRFD